MPRKATRKADTKKGSPKSPKGGASTAADPAASHTLFVGRELLSRLMGFTADTISDFTARGMPVHTKGGHGKPSTYDAIACLKWMRNQTGKGGTESPKDRAQARAYIAQAELNELKLKREQGEVVERAVVVRDTRAMLKAISSTVRSLPRRFVQVGILARDQEPAATELLRDVLTDLSTWKTPHDVEASRKAAERV